MSHEISRAPSGRPVGEANLPSFTSASRAPRGAPVGEANLPSFTSTEPDLAALPDPAMLRYEQARDELVAVVGRLEAGGEPLETSLALWERGEALANRCQEWLDGARERLAAVQAAAAVRTAAPAGRSAQDQAAPGTPATEDDDA